MLLKSYLILLFANPTIEVVLDLYISFILSYKDAFDNLQYSESLFQVQRH